MSGLNNLIGPDDGPGVGPGDTRDVDGPYNPVGLGDNLGLDVVLEVGRDDHPLNDALAVDDLSADTFLGLDTGLGVDLGAELSLLTHSSLCPGHKDLPGVDLGPGDGDELGVCPGLDLSVDLGPGDDNLLGWHGLDIGADYKAGVDHCPEDCLGWKLAGLHLRPCHIPGLDAGLAGNSADNSPGDHLVLEVSGGNLSELGLNLSAWNIDGTFTGLGVLHNLGAESGLSLSDEPGLTGNSVGDDPLDNLSPCDGICHKLCVLDGVDLCPCDFNDPGNIDGLGPEVGAGNEDLRNLSAGNYLGLHLNLCPGHHLVGAVSTS